MRIDIQSPVYLDKVLGCWRGKNCGGTLGGPLEIAWGLKEPFNISWYTQLENLPIPNDDLELQLIWLKALEDIGPNLKARDFARYWLSFVGYNFDEYGMHKTNLRLGLLPPLSGRHNNWFSDCMGSPIRSELWACVAPGHPRIAARYAYEDAICDHAGGEGVYGSLFNAAVESAAFVLSDPQQLIHIGLSYIPADSLTAKAVQAALNAHTSGLSWQEARARVLEAAPNHNAQFAPPNIGFQIIGWLYGADFGDALCTAVNCGYDTDCTGATLGSYLGILHGAAALPPKWTEALGDAIATSPAPQIRNTGNALPENLGELTERVARQALRVLAWHGIPPVSEVKLEELFADDAIRELWGRKSLSTDWELPPLELSIHHTQPPVITPGGKHSLKVQIRNTQPVALSTSLKWQMPEGWSLNQTQQANVFTLPPQATKEFCFALCAPAAPEAMQPSNRLDLYLHCNQWPAMPTIPVILLAPFKGRRSELYPLEQGDASCSLDTAYPPEHTHAAVTHSSARAGQWVDFYSTGNDLAPAFKQGDDRGGVLYLQMFIFLESARHLRVGASAAYPAKIFVNNECIAHSSSSLPVRPSYAGLAHPELGAHAYANHRFNAGWNEILLKFVLPPNAPVAATPHLTLADADNLLDGLTDALRHLFPWEPAPIPCP